MFSTPMEWTDGDERYSASGSAEENCWISSQLSRVAQLRWSSGGAHHWARQLIQLGHEVRLIPPAYVKPFVKRQKNDAIDAEAICEAAQRPNMRFVAVKSEQQQAASLVFRTRDLLVRQRTQLINAIRGHLTEYGWIAPKGPSHVAMLADLIEEEEMASSLPEATHASSD
jgi:transposase